MKYVEIHSERLLNLSLVSSWHQMLNISSHIFPGCLCFLLPRSFKYAYAAQRVMILFSHSVSLVLKLLLNDLLSAEMQRLADFSQSHS